MDKKEKIENDEYKERIKELIDIVEKNKEIYKDTPEGYQRVVEEKESLKQTAISRINPNYRNERIILIFVYLIRDYNRRIADPIVAIDKDQLQKEIDSLYKLIYEELKKPSLYNPNLNPNRRNTADLIERRRILEKMAQVLGVEELDQFYKEYNIDDLVHSPSKWKNNVFTPKQKLYLTIMVIAVLIIGTIFVML